MRRRIPPFNMAGVDIVRIPRPLSLFQTLPYDVIDRIIEYTVGGIDPDRNEFWRKSYPLMQCCKNWRVAFIQSEFSEMAIRLRRKLPFGLTFSKNAYPANPRLYPIEECVRHLVFSVDSWKRLSTGETLEWMRSSVEMGRINKAAVSYLRIEGFSGDEWHAYFEKDTDGAVTRLVELLTYLHETFPNIKTVSLNILKWDFLKHVDSDDHRVEKALAALFHGRDVGMYAKTVKDSFKTMDPRYFIGMASLSIESNNCTNYLRYSNDWVMEVVRVNAPTLRKLHVCIIRDMLLQGITTSKTGDLMTYPKLKSITTEAPCFYSNPQRNRVHAFAMGKLPEHDFRHFPALEHINLCGRPFGLPPNHDIYDRDHDFDNRNFDDRINLDNYNFNNFVNDDDWPHNQMPSTLRPSKAKKG
ncbi:hypothetical protein GGI15_000053 [Coemansia interrupta]|uniref:Uncharacterized protein n=1 Tax=Coemansia interrupta TaxID=1126814 RepID=A0A9W8HRS8_9FUNG|nr:hypothetical protein GGI15_000053 [Coemansia interrupta]